ncbi:MAG TPA: nicotinate phosphoribosyltransferase [Kouleothrix sp.]|uniref:nicotinate phosphoribosyltransferase n=1 Tax=Kouleothrix sp. TaxID=2779161 RepID=UPI002C714E03|nr:nicotinate phosphoribosyltransferase [Kouleothrix sp.]HRC75162.1 nicotinate phosphoribosyltransferase [Kouleothrix sp.]
MSIFDGQRLNDQTFKLDAERMRAGWYSDKYFENIVGMLGDLSRRGYRFGGSSTRLAAIGVDPRGIDVGDLVVEMQWFTRRQPCSVVAGVDKALAMLKCCTGYFSDGSFVNTYDQLEVEAVHDGAIVRYSGDPLNVQPVLKVRGRYRDFALLETPSLGALTRATRIATNVYNVLVAARGKPVLFFPARFDAHEVQAADGYAYNIAVQRFNHDHGHTVSSFISTDAQGDWWGGLGGGTVAHAAIAAFLGDTVECMLAFAETRPVEIPRIALIDFDNDCVGTTMAVMDAMFARYRELTDAGQLAEAERYRLFGVRPDTSGTLRDKSVPPIGQKDLDMGVTPRLVFYLRQAIDDAWQRWQLTPAWAARARQWCREVKIVVTGGFGPRKIRRFEELGVPADIYGVGSSLFSNSDEEGTNNDFTADIVRVKVAGAWHDLVKTGRRACDNPDLSLVTR